MRLNRPSFPDLSIYKHHYKTVCACGHHFITSLLSTVSLVRPVEVTGMCGGGGTWQMVQGHGSPAQCWKPEPSCRAGGAAGGEPFIRECCARIDVSPGSALDSVEDVEEVKALPRRGCT